jgi:hypothetical protein
MLDVLQTSRVTTITAQCFHIVLELISVKAFVEKRLHFAEKLHTILLQDQ